MAKTKLYAQWPFLVAVAILLVVIYIVGREESSFFARTTQWVSTQLEGFAVTTPTTPQCPTGYKFFNDARGESMCCAGEVNRYSHKCLSRGINELCSMKKGVPDPRDPSRTLSWCTDILQKTTAAAAVASCPPSHPNYARIGKCCARATDLDGYDCSAADNSNPGNFCSVSGGGCATLKLDQSTSCAPGFNKISYALGAKEKAKYGAAAEGKKIPVCFSMDGTCIPDNVVTAMQKEGIYRDKTDLSSWLYACSGWDRIKNRKDLTGKIDNTYV